MSEEQDVMETPMIEKAEPFDVDVPALLDAGSYFIYPMEEASRKIVESLGLPMAVAGSHHMRVIAVAQDFKDPIIFQALGFTVKTGRCVIIFAKKQPRKAVEALIDSFSEEVSPYHMVVIK